MMNQLQFDTVLYHNRHYDSGRMTEEIFKMMNSLNQHWKKSPNIFKCPYINFDFPFYSYMIRLTVAIKIFLFTSTDLCKKKLKDIKGYADFV